MFTKSRIQAYCQPGSAQAGVIYKKAFSFDIF